MRHGNDNQHLATAEDIQLRRPHWMVLWGVLTRLYWAFPQFDTTTRICLCSPDPADLIHQMDAAERQYRTPPPQRRYRPERTSP
ncbi:MAG TPA: hypothetical protein VGL63_06715 [Streptosporangiaceae bacterium]